MPRSKHRRKGKIRLRRGNPVGQTFEDPKLAALLTDAESGGAFDDADADPGLAEALALAEIQLDEELDAAGLDDNFDAADKARADKALQSLYETVEQQVRDNDPPEAGVALARLIADGHSRDTAITLIGTTLLLALREAMMSESEFNHAGYARALVGLGDLSRID